MRAVATTAGAFVLVLVVLLAAVGQLGKINHRTIGPVLVASAVAGVVAGLRANRSGR